jgi:hypothetical protein
LWQWLELEGDCRGGRREASFGNSAESKDYAECENEIKPDTDQLSAPLFRLGATIGAKDFGKHFGIIKICKFTRGGFENRKRHGYESETFYLAGDFPRRQTLFIEYHSPDGR